MITLGDYNTLKILRRAEPGLYLEGDEKTGDILLPNRFITPQMHIGDELRVFVYLDQEERLIATTEQPLARVGEFAYLKVAWTNQYGAFLHWGLMKDLFCPFREQKQRMQRDKSYIVYVKVDEESYRLMASAKVEKYLPPSNLSQPGEKAPLNPPNRGEMAAPDSAAAITAEATPFWKLEGITHGQQVDCLVWQKTDLGFKAIVNNRYQGQLYDNQIFQPLHSGDRLTAYVDHVRQDGKIDLTLQPTGRQQTLDFAEVLLRYLYENGGRCNLSDSSPAELIADRFHVSKKTFKRAVGDLYRRRLILIGDEGIRLAD